MTKYVLNVETNVIAKRKDYYIKVNYGFSSMINDLDSKLWTPENLIQTYLFFLFIFTFVIFSRLSCENASNNNTIDNTIENNK